MCTNISSSEKAKGSLNLQMPTHSRFRQVCYMPIQKGVKNAFVLQGPRWVQARPREKCLAKVCSGARAAPPTFELPAWRPFQNPI